MATYDLGDVIALSVNVKDSTGTLANATAVVCTITLPDGTTSTPTVVNSTTGVYSVGYSPTMSGRHLVRWVATGANASAYSDTFSVLDNTRLPIVSLADAKAHLNITSTTNDDELRRILDVVTQVGEAWTGRVFGRRSVTETVSGGFSALALSAKPIISVTSVVENGTTLTAADYALNPPEAGVLTRLSGTSVKAWTAGAFNVTVTYVAGYLVQPAADVGGCLEMLRHIWETQRGSLSMLPRASDEWNPAQAFSIPRRVQELWDLNVIPSV